MPWFEHPARRATSSSPADFRARSGGPPLSRPSIAKMTLLALALTIVPLVTAGPAQASTSCNALNDPSGDGFYYQGRFLAGFLQAGDVITISAGFPIGTAPKPFVPTAFFLGIGSFDAPPSVPGVNFPGTLVYTVPQDIMNVHLNWVTGPSIPDGYTVSVTWQVSCQNAPKSSPTLSTQASPSALLGGPVYDTATLAGGNAPTGTIAFRLYGPDDANCNGPVVFTTSTTVAGNGSYQSAAFTPSAAGTYRWTADYSGDGKNNAALSACNAASESVLIKPFAPPPPTSTLSGNVSGPVTVASGQSVVVTDGQVVGPITIQAGGALQLVNTKVTNGVVATDPSFLSICNSQVSAPLRRSHPGCRRERGQHTPQDR